MKRAMICCLVFLAAHIAVLITFVTETKAQNTVEGTLTVNDETIPLNNIYVFQQEDEVAVFMTDVPVPPDKRRTMNFSSLLVVMSNSDNVTDTISFSVLAALASHPKGR